MAEKTINSGPIPGENYTSDTKNYPWHRPPEFDNLDDAIEYSFKKITDNKTAISMMTLAKNGVPLSTITEIFLMGGIARGKWTPDYALLMAGPLTHILSLMAKAGKIKFTYGFEDEPIHYTDAYFREIKKLTTDEEASAVMMGDMAGGGFGVEEEEEPMQSGPGGFMSPPGQAPEETAPQAPDTMGAEGMMSPEGGGMEPPGVAQQMAETPDINMV